MRRLAFVSPLPPAATGIADYSADVLALLAPSFALDVFHDPVGESKRNEAAVDRERLPPACKLYPMSELLARHTLRPYDLAVYQLGNDPRHARVYDLLPRLPGLLVLHDLVLHHSRARQFLDSPAARIYAADPSNAALRDAARDSLIPYREELAYNYPRQAERLLDTHLGTVGTLLPYAYPLFRLPVEAARVVAVHNHYMAAAIRKEVPEAKVVKVPMPATAVPVTRQDILGLRAHLGLAEHDFVVGCFGLLTREKQVETVARAVARAAAALPHLRLLLVGPVPQRKALESLLERLGLSGRAVVTGRVSFSTLATHIEAADCVVHLRYPTARETSAALLRVLAQGRPTVISDLEHQAEIPAAAVVRADVVDEEGEVTRALLRLANRPSLRARLGRAAAEFVAREHAPERCRAAYMEAIERALARPTPLPREGWPDHWRSA